jgi:hypothetical protein
VDYLQINTWAFPYWTGYHPETPILARDAVEGQYGSRDDNLTRPIWKCPYVIRDYYMTFSISALVLARDFHIKPDSEAGGLIWVEG